MHLPRRSVVGRIACACVEALEERQLLSASLFKDINTGTNRLISAWARAAGNLVYFDAEPLVAQDSVYQSDGTDAGTRAIQPSWGGADPLAITNSRPIRLSQRWEPNCGRPPGRLPTRRS